MHNDCTTRLPGIERGRISEHDSAGYTVESIDRPGIITPPLNPINDNSYTTGDVVYFFMFPDGTGKIVCGI